MQLFQEIRVEDIEREAFSISSGSEPARQPLWSNVQVAWDFPWSRPLLYGCGWVDHAFRCSASFILCNHRGLLRMSGMRMRQEYGHFQQLVAWKSSKQVRQPEFPKPQ